MDAAERVSSFDCAQAIVALMAGLLILLLLIQPETWLPHWVSGIV